MKEIIEQYGGVIVTVIAICALIVLIQALMKDGGTMSEAFHNMINTLYNKGTSALNTINVTAVNK